MNIREITKNVHYVGVNDRTTERFEGLWPIPNGVSYNSYIVKGTEKTALIDTVEIGSIRDLFHSIFSENGEEKIDYVVINHMEPDHSGGINAVLAAYPDAKLVGNKQTIAMVKGYYHIPDDRFLEIGDGSTIDLGGKTLRFILTPMVHWPETMMTYIEEDGILFSGDAFGTFGALNGGVVDYEMETGWYDNEMYRYYSNIVGKYGRFVQKALAKASDLDIKYICSTHGPVWHDRISEIVGIYDKLSKYEPEAGVTIIYGSMYGNTAEIAEEIARQLAVRGIKNIKIHNAAKASLSDMISDAFRYEGLIIGSPTYSMRIFPPVEQFLIAMETREMKNKVMATFGSFTWASAAYKQIIEHVKKCNLDIVGSIEMKHSASADIYRQISELADNFVKALTKK